MKHGADLVAFVDKGKGNEKQWFKDRKDSLVPLFYHYYLKEEKTFFEIYEFGIQSTPAIHCIFQNYKFNHVIPASYPIMASY